MKKIIIIIILLWLSIAITRSMYNISKIVTEESQWIGLTLTEKRVKFFGQDYLLIDSIAKRLNFDSKVIVFSGDAKLYLLARYFLYPIRIYHAKDLASFREETGRQKIDFIILENTNALERISIVRYVNKSATRINNRISVISL